MNVYILKLKGQYTVEPSAIKGPSSKREFNDEIFFINDKVSNKDITSLNTLLKIINNARSDIDYYKAQARMRVSGKIEMTVTTLTGSTVPVFRTGILTISNIQDLSAFETLMKRGLCSGNELLFTSPQLSTPLLQDEKQEVSIPASYDSICNRALKFIIG